VLTFALPRAARLVFVVRQLAPVCRVVTRFVTRGKAGVNRIRFPRPGSRLALRAGTYRISGWTRSGRLVERVVVVVFELPPNAAQLQAARAANVCGPTATLVPGSTASSPERVERALSPTRSPAANGPVLKPGSFPGRVLGSAIDAARAIRPMLVVLLGLSILLLGIASLPRLAFLDRRVNELLAQHRLEFLAFGAAALVAVLITFLIH
jgi:hypothetical protein